MPLIRDSVYIGDRESDWLGVVLVMKRLNCVFAGID